MRIACEKAASSFLESEAPCSYIDQDTKLRCVINKPGHTKGHQTLLGFFLDGGEFEPWNLDGEEFVHAVELEYNVLVDLIKANTTNTTNTVRSWRQAVHRHHQGHLQKLRSLLAYPQSKKVRAARQKSDFLKHMRILSRDTPASLLTAMEDAENRPFIISRFCYGCLFGRSEYRLPCGHMVCVLCLKGNDSSSLEFKSTATVHLRRCVICDSDDAKEGWPHTVSVLPDLVGPRILSLDGGGIRSIVQSVILKRLESNIGLRLPIGRFFDLIVGTSTGLCFYLT